MILKVAYDKMSAYKLAKDGRFDEFKGLYFP